MSATAVSELTPDQLASRVATLLDAARSQAWSMASDLPWQLEVDPERVGTPLRSLLQPGLPALRKMRPSQRRQLAFREACFHLSNLLSGERSGQTMLEQILTLRRARADREFLAIMAHEESKHSVALERYLTDKAKALFPADARLVAVLSALEAHPSPEFKLLVGQVVLEGTAASLIASLLCRAKEPLCAAILRYNLRDEARHIAYGYLILPPLLRALRGVPRVTEAQDLVFESIVGSVRGLLAIPVWREAGLPLAAAKRQAILRLGETGVMTRYTQTIPRLLARRGFPTARLERLLGSRFAQSLLAHAE
jgi:hypothetical protein